MEFDFDTTEIRNIVSKGHYKILKEDFDQHIGSNSIRFILEKDNKKFIFKASSCKEIYYKCSVIPELISNGELTNSEGYGFYYIYEFIEGKKLFEIKTLDYKIFKSIIQMYLELRRIGISVKDLNIHNIIYNPEKKISYFIDLGGLRTIEYIRKNKCQTCLKNEDSEEQMYPRYDETTEAVEIFNLASFICNDILGEYDVAIDKRLKKTLSKMHETKLILRYKTFKEILEDLNSIT